MGESSSGDFISEENVLPTTLLDISQSSLDVAVVEERWQENTLSGEGTVTMEETSPIPGEDVTTSSKDVITSGEGVITSGEAVSTSGEGVITSGEAVSTSGEGVITSGEAVSTSGEGVSTSGEGVITSCEAVSTSGEGVSTSGEEATTLGEEITTPSEGISTLDKGITASDEDVVTSGDYTITRAKDTLTPGGDAVTSGEEAATSGDEAALSGDESATSGDEAATSGDEAAISGDESALSGDESATSGNEAASSGDEAAISGDEAATSGDEAATSGDEAATSGDEAAISGDEAATSGDEAALSGDESATSGDEIATSGEDSGTSGEDADSTSEFVASTGDIITSDEDVIKSTEDIDTSGEDVFTADKDTDLSGDYTVIFKEDTVTSYADRITLGTGFVTYGEDSESSGTDIDLLGEGRSTSGAETFTSDEGAPTSGVDKVTPSVGIALSGEHTVTTGEDLVTSGEETIISDEDTVTSGEEIITSGEVTVSSGEEIFTSSEEIITSGEDIITSGEYTDTSGEEIIISGEDTVISGEEIITSGEEIITSGEEIIISGEDTVTSGEEIIISGEDTVTSGEEIITSGEDTVTSGEEIITSNEDTVTSGKEIFPPGKSTTLTDTEISSKLFATGEEQSTNGTAEGRESGELELRTSPAHDVLKSSEETLEMGTQQYEEITFSMTTLSRNVTSKETITAEQGITEAASSVQEVFTIVGPGRKQTSGMMFEEGQGKSGITSQSTTEDGEERIVSVTPDNREVEVVTIVRVSQAEVKEISTDSLLTTSREMTTPSSASTIQGRKELTQVTKLVVTSAPTEDETTVDLAICVEDELDFSSLSGGIISILSRIKNLLSRTSCKTPDMLYSSTISPLISSDTRTQILDSSTRVREDTGAYSDRGVPFSTAATSPASTSIETSDTTSAVPLLLTSNGVHLKDIDHLTVTTSVDKIIKASTTRKITSRKPKPGVATRAGTSSTKSTPEYTSSYPLHPLHVLTHGVETATLSSDSGKMTYGISDVNETAKTTPEFQPFSTGKTAEILKIPTEHAAKTTSSEIHITERFTDVTEKPGPLSTTLESLVILLYDTLSTTVSEEPTSSPGLSKTEAPYKESSPGMTQRSFTGKEKQYELDTSSVGTEFARSSPLLPDRVTVTRVSTPKHLTLGVTDNGLQLPNRELSTAPAEGITHRDDHGVHGYSSTKSAAVLNKGSYVDIIIDKEATTSSSEKRLGYTESADVITTKSTAYPTNNAARPIPRRPLWKKPRVFRGRQGRIFYTSPQTARTNPPTIYTTTKEAGMDRKGPLSGDIDGTVYRKGEYYTTYAGYDDSRSYSRKDTGGRLTVYTQGGVRQENYDTGRENTATFTVYSAARDVLRISNETAVQTYSQARQMLRKSLEQLAALWRNSVHGLVEVVYVPSLQRFVDYGTHLNVAYKNIRRAYEYGSSVLHKTYYAASRQITRYYTGLIDYFNSSYSYYYDLFQASRRRY